VLIAVNTVRNTVEQNQKSRNVTADEGLVITVEDEPSAWCSSYPVRLKVYVKRETVTSVSVNGSSYTPDEDGMITVNADNWVLDAEVKTESATRSARIEIAYLDGDAPVLEVKKEGNQIALVAVDARSDVEGIYYAATSEEAYSQMPYYQKYTEPLSYEEGTVYRFYAKDKAGNCSTPVVSTMDTAQSFSLNQTEVSLYPGETFGLSVTAEPEGALLENIRYESMDESVATVEQNGKVTAVGNGTAAIRVTADMLESQICTVTVSNERTITISAIGDCTLGTDENFNTSTNFDAFDAVNGHSYFFQNVSSILSQDDITFANFEGTLTDSTSRASKEYAFKGDASYTDILNLGSVEVVTLANNHSSDYGEESLTDTEQALTDAGIDYCNGDTIVIREVNGVKTAFIGIYVLDIGMERESQVKETIARAQKQGAQLIIVAFHWGTEKSNYPDETQTSLAHTAIDCGADLVVGHHPHVLQGIEKYNGKYIVYSLGNFCFGGNSSPSDMDTIIFQQTFTVSASGVLDTDEINIIPCKISSASGYNNYQPAPASGTDAEEIISRLNEYSAAYGQTYTAADIQ
jgi:poly-gamma-glutamate synthesis protein (capsule biosynthesis protein)